MMTSNAVVFSYSSLPPSVVDTLKPIAMRIKRRIRSSVEDLFAIGHDLIEARATFEADDSFMGWVRSEFDMSRATAWRFISVADRYWEERSNLEHLPITALYELASPSLPDDVREKVEERVMAEGEVVTAAEIIKLRREAAEARAETNQLREDKAALADRVADLTDEVVRVTKPTVIKLEPDREALNKLYDSFISLWRSLPMELRDRFFAEHETAFSKTGYMRATA